MNAAQPAVEAAYTPFPNSLGSTNIRAHELHTRCSQIIIIII